MPESRAFSKFPDHFSSYIPLSALEGWRRVYTIAVKAAHRIRRALISQRQQAGPELQSVLVVTCSVQRQPRPQPVLQPTNRPVIVFSRGWSRHPLR